MYICRRIIRFPMKVEYNNLYTHFVFTTFNRMPLILEKFRERIENISREYSIIITVIYMPFMLILSMFIFLFHARQILMKRY